MQPEYQYLIVGSGLFGATFAHLASEAGMRCLVVEKRPHTGGNIYCETIEGIHVHTYGAHIFHTDSPEVWRFVNRFTPFRPFVHSPLADFHGKRYHLPFNMHTFRQLWGVTTPEEARTELERQRAEAMEALRAGGAGAPRNLEEQALCLVGRDLFETLVREYTEKQWGRSCKELPAFIIRRLPVRYTYDNNYFNDPFQGIPEGGYNRLTEGLLKHTECLTGTDFFTSPFRDWRRYARKLVYTGPIDAYFGYRYGRLDWRTVIFRTRVEDTPDFQGHAVINYTSHDQPYTRVIEHKHFEMSGREVLNCPRTVVSEEYSTEYREGMEPFYPVNNGRNDRLYRQYQALADAEKDVIFGGRLAEYTYYDMGPVIRRAAEAFRTDRTGAGAGDEDLFSQQTS